MFHSSAIVRSEMKAQSAMCTWHGHWHHMAIGNFSADSKLKNFTEVTIHGAQGCPGMPRGTVGFRLEAFTRLERWTSTASGHRFGARVTADRIPQLSAKEFGDLAWSVARSNQWKGLREPGSEDWRECVSFMIAVPGKVTELETKPLAGALWALALVPARLVSARSINPVSALCDEASVRLGEMEAVHAVNVAWAIGFMKHRDGEPFLEKLSAKLPASAREFGAGQLVALAWAFARTLPKNRDVQAWGDGVGSLVSFSLWLLIFFCHGGCNPRYFLF